MSNLNLTDYLALERTRLANERTSMAYFRTYAVIFGSGLAILKLEVTSEIKGLGIFFVVVSHLLLMLGIARYFYVRNKLNRLEK